MDATESHVLSAEQISDQLAKDIIHSVYPVGSKLPTERDLASKFGVTRHVVREALKRLESIGLVRIRQGSGIFAEPLSIKATVELMHLVVRNEDGSLNLKVLYDLLEYRQTIGCKVVRLAAERRSDEQLAQMKLLLRRRRGFLNDPDRLLDLDEEFMRVLGAASHNMIFDMMYESFARVSTVLRFNYRMSEADRMVLQENTEKLVDAIEKQDPDAAEEVTRRQFAIYSELSQKGAVVIEEAS